MSVPRVHRPVEAARAPARTALVVDDDVGTRHLLEDLLSLHGFAVHAVNDARAGCLAFADLRPECVLVGLASGESATYESLRAMRRLPGGSQAVVIVLSTLDARTAWRAWDNGPDLFVTKPFDTQRLLNYLDVRQTARPAEVILPGYLVPGRNRHELLQPLVV